MRTIYFFVAVFFVLILQSCYKPGDIQIQNNISNVVITDVSWGDNYISSELLPGESSPKITIERYDEKLPSAYTVSFVMTANNKSVYLETNRKFTLDQDDFLMIVLTDSTRVANPNE